MTPAPDLLLAGEIGKPHGIGGEVYVVRISDDPHRFDAGARLLRRDGAELVVERARTHRDRFLVKFEGCDSRSEAERLRGPLYVPGSETRDLEAGEYWEHEVVGCTVVDRDGRPLGVVRSVSPGPAQDLLVIDTQAGERLVPFVDEIVVAVDTTSRRVEVDPPAGLLD